jgi:hypothetical protein
MLLDYEHPDSSAWQLQFVGQWSVKLGGGTEEIQCNIVGERVLGLPSEPRAGQDVPFRRALSGNAPP